MQTMISYKTTGLHIDKFQFPSFSASAQWNYTHSDDSDGLGNTAASPPHGKLFYILSCVEVNLNLL